LKGRAGKFKIIGYIWGKITILMNLIEALEEIEDFRSDKGLRYPLSPLLLVTIISIISGHQGYREISRFAKANQDIFLELFPSKRTVMPSHVTFREVIKGIDFEQVKDAFHTWALQYVTISDDEWFAVDGKCLGSTIESYSTSYQNFVSLISVFSHQRGQVLAVDSLENKKASEIPTVQEIIKMLDLEGVIFTLDALHCQKKTVDAILETNNHFVIQVKLNQPKLTEACISIADACEPLTMDHSQKRSRGRNEIREVYVYTADERIPKGWRGIKTVIKVVRKTVRDGLGSIETSFYISDIERAAKVFAKGIRGHWSVENRLHYVKDVLQGEDNAGIAKDNGVKTLSILKNMAINISRENGYDSIKDAQVYFASNVEELLLIVRT